MGWAQSMVKGSIVRYVWIGVAAGLLSWALTGLVLLAARRNNRLALPTSRGLHSTPTPVGGGLGLIAATVIVWACLNWPPASDMLRLGGAVLVLGAVSWIDDRQPLPPAVRFITQALAVGATLWFLPQDVRVFKDIPQGLERAVVAFGWLWVINLTNFMDGIDGLAGTEAATVGLGYFILTQLMPGSSALVGHLSDLALMIAAAATGYLAWNWAPASIFMGDVGSIPLGFMFGLLMLDLGVHAQWAAAIILPLYFLADATLTLLDRLRRGVKPWEAHREHAYQRAVLAGMSHQDVALHIAVLNVALMALAVYSLQAPLSALVAATALTAALLVWLRSRRAATETTPRA